MFDYLVHSMHFFVLLMNIATYRSDLPDPNNVSKTKILKSLNLKHK